MKSHTLDLRPYHVRNPYTPLRRFYAWAGFVTISVMVAHGIAAFLFLDLGLFL